jgi:hypothetical protein
LCELRIHPGLDSSWVGDSIVPILAGPRYIPLRASLSQNVNEINQSNEKNKTLIDVLLLEIQRNAHQVPAAIHNNNALATITTMLWQRVWLQVLALGFLRISVFFLRGGEFC